jgi:hypothetical protein
MDNGLKVPFMNRPPEALWFRTIHAKAVSRLSSLIDFHTNRPTAALVFAFSLGIGLSRIRSTVRRTGCGRHPFDLCGPDRIEADQASRS